MQPEYKIGKLIGCVNVKPIFHTIIRYKNHQLVTLLRGCSRSHYDERQL